MQRVAFSNLTKKSCRRPNGQCWLPGTEPLRNRPEILLRKGITQRSPLERGQTRSALWIFAVGTYERRPRARCYPPPPYPLFATHLHFSANHGATRQPIVKTTHKNALGLKWCLRGHLRTWHESSCTKGSASPIWSEKVPTGLPILSMPSWPSELTLFPYVSKRAHMSNGKPTPNISPHHSGARTCGSYQP